MNAQRARFGRLAVLCVLATSMTASISGHGRTHAGRKARTGNSSATSANAQLAWSGTIARADLPRLTDGEAGAASPTQTNTAPSTNAKGPGPVTGIGTDGQIAIWNGAYTVGDSIITAHGGNVGIATLDPTSRLTVAGTIESTRSGFKFPDGTLQSSAGLSLVAHDPSLAGTGTTDSPLGIGAGGVTASRLATGAAPTPGQVLGFNAQGLVWLSPASSINGVTHNKTLTGDGNATPLGISDGGVGRNQIGDGAVNAPKIASGQVVKSLNGLFDDVTVVGGANVTITPSGNTITIAAQQNDAIVRVIHDTTLAGDGTPAIPLGIRVPLVLTGSQPGVALVSATNGTGAGVQGKGGIGVLGLDQSIDPAEAINGCGVEGLGGSIGVIGVGDVFGVNGEARSPGPDNAGVLGVGAGDEGVAHAGVGVRGNGGSGGNGGVEIDTSGGTGVLGVGGAHPRIGGDGVLGIGADVVGNDPALTGGNGVVGIGGESDHGTGGTAVMGFGSVGGADSLSHAGFFDGDVEVTGSLSKGGGSFKIDHPLDPENKYLYHSFVESPDMKNIYDGVTILDANGEATVDLPEWFSTLNRDFRYQLTAIGAPAPGLYVATEVADNRFGIAGGAPGMKVSWQLTGIRQDAYANAHRIPVEEAKPERERGTYLHPDAFHQPDEKDVEWVRHPEVMKAMKAARERVNP